MESEYKHVQVGRFHENHRANILLLGGGTVAYRKKGYERGVVFTQHPISIGRLFEVKIEETDPQWFNSLVRANLLEPVLKWLASYYVTTLSQECGC